MSFPTVPECSRSKVDRAGFALIDPKVNKKDYFDAIKIVNAWRVSHAYPINTFNATLRRKVKHFQDPIVAQRLKRLPTIILKLKRFSAMRLSRMQDIGGVRGIVNSIDEVRQLADQYQDKNRFTHELVRMDNYISKPKDDGYRGVHLVFRYNNTLARNNIAASYKGLLLELQLRTKLQHTWATAVETMGTFRGEALKSHQGSREWRDFFALTSSAFAYVEGTAPVPKYSNLSVIDTCKLIAKTAKNLNVLEQIKGLSVAANAIHSKGYGGFYNLIVLNSEQHTVRIRSYSREQVRIASRDYAAAEAEALKGAKIEPVLVSAGRLKQLKRAYPNYFLDIRDFIAKVENIIKVSENEL